MQKKENFFVRVGKFLLDILLRIVYVFRDLGLGIWGALVAVKNALVKFGKRFMDGSIWTKLSHVIMGAGNIARKQFVKGAIFLGLEVLFIVFMVISPTSTGTHLGAKAIEGFFSLGEYEGMPLDATYDFDKHFSQVFVIAEDATEDTVFAVEETIALKTYRINNILDAIENNVDKVVKTTEENRQKNSKGKEIYKLDEYSHVVYDDRWGTNDYYAYDYFTLGESDSMQVEGGTLVWIDSATKIDAEIKAAISFEKDTTECGVFCQQTKTGYRYLIIVKAIGKGDTLTLSAINANVEVSKIDYEADYVQMDVDFSFLMLLFGVITFAIIALFLVVYNLSIASSYKTDKDLREGKKPTTFIEDLKTLLDSRFHLTLLTPAIILLVVFTVVPTILMILISFTDMQTNAASSGLVLISWKGLANFVELFSGSSSSGSMIAAEVGKNFASVLTWTFEWALLATFSCYFGGIFLALLINKKEVKFKKMWRTIFILTIAIPQFITLLVLRNLLSGNGPINTMLKEWGWISESINFLQFGSNTSTPVVTGGVWLARITVLLINLYIGIPYTMLMTSGILMNIPKDLYEAATIDGANKWQMFRKITLPYVIFVTTPYLISSFIGNITSFNTIFLTTGGGPSKGTGSIAGHTDLLVTWLYKLTMEDSKFNAGSIIGILTFIITAFITLVCYRNSKAYKEEDTFQ